MLLRGSLRETVSNRVAHSGALAVGVKDVGVCHHTTFGPEGACLVRLALPVGDLQALSGVPPCAPWQWRNDLALSRAFLRALHATEDGAHHGALCDLLALLGSEDTESARGAPPQWLVLMVQRVGDAWSPTLSVRTLAAETGVHPVYLARCMRRWYGVSLSALLRYERLRHAATRVLTSRDRLSMIAYGAGFADEAHCSRTISRCLGASPTVLRARLAALRPDTNNGAAIRETGCAHSSA